MADAAVLEIGYSSQQLEGVHFDEDVGKGLLLALVEEPDHPVNVLRNVFHKQMQVHLLLPLLPILFYFFGLFGVVVVVQLYYAGVVELLEYLQLPIFVVLVLQHLLHSDTITRRLKSGQVHHSKSTLTNNFVDVKLPVLLL